MVRNSGNYRGLSDFLVDNPLIREGYQFNLKIEKAPIPQGMYYLSPAEGKLVAVGSGIRYDVSSLFNGRYRVDVEVTDELQSASQARIEKSLSKTALTSITDGIQTKTSVRALTPGEVAEFTKAGIDQRHAIGKQLNEALTQNARIVNRKVMSLDVESMVSKESKRILHQDVFSVGMAESVDTTYSPADKVLHQNPRLRKSTFAATSSFDIEKTISMFKQDIGEIEKVSTYGRQNLALVLDHVNKYVNGQAMPDSDTFDANRESILKQTFGTSSQVKQVQQGVRDIRGPSLESIMEIRSPTQRNEALNGFIMRNLQPYGEKGEKMVGFLENVSRRLRDSKLIKDSSAVEHSAHAGLMTEFSLGRVAVATSEARGPGTSALSFQKDVMADSVLKMYNAVSNEGTKQILTFGDAESNVYKSYGLALEKELGVLNNSGPLSREDQLRKRSLNEIIEKLGVVRKAFVDVKERSEQVFDSLLPGIRQHLKENSTGVRSVFERLLGSESTQRINQWGVERFLDQKHSGFSLENLYHVFKNSKYTEWHTGGMDSADLGHFNLWLEDLMKNQDRYKAPSSKNMPGPGLTMLENKNLEMFNVTSKLARNIQSRTVINELLRDKSNDEIMGLINKAFENGNERTKALITSSRRSLTQFDKAGNDTLFKKGVVELFQQTVNTELRDHSIKLNAQPTSMKYRAPEPSLLGKVVSSAGAGRFFALAAAVYFGARSAEEDPGASIETGEHNSTETTQRRLVTTPFGSAISKLAAVLSPFANKLVAGAEMGSLNPETYSATLQSFIRNHFDDASQVVTDRLAMSPAVDSLANRLARTTVLATDTATHIPSLRKSVNVMASRMERQNLNFFERITNLRSERVTPRLTNPDNLALHMEGMNIHTPGFRDRFYMGSVPSARSIEMELSPSTKTFDTFLYGDPLSFAKHHEGIAMAEDVVIQNNRVHMARPSFSIKQKRRAPERLIDSVRLKPGIIHDLSKQAEFPMIRTESSPNISAMVIGRRQAKPGASVITLSSGSSYDGPTSVFGIEGTLQNYSPIDKASPAAANVLRTSGTGFTRSPVFSDRVRTSMKKNTFAINTSNIQLDASPVYFNKPIRPAQQVMTDRPYRPVSGYHEQVNGLLQMKAQVGYPQKVNT